MLSGRLPFDKVIASSPPHDSWEASGTIKRLRLRPWVRCLVGLLLLGSIDIPLHAYPLKCSQECRDDYDKTEETTKKTAALTDKLGTLSPEAKKLQESVTALENRSWASYDKWSCAPGTISCSADETKLREARAALVKELETLLAKEKAAAEVVVEPEDVTTPPPSSCPAGEIPGFWPDGKPLCKCPPGQSRGPTGACRSSTGGGGSGGGSGGGQQTVCTAEIPKCAAGQELVQNLEGGCPTHVCIGKTPTGPPGEEEAARRYPDLFRDNTDKENDAAPKSIGGPNASDPSKVGLKEIPGWQTQLGGNCLDGSGKLKTNCSAVETDKAAKKAPTGLAPDHRSGAGGDTPNLPDETFQLASLIMSPGKGPTGLRGGPRGEDGTDWRDGQELERAKQTVDTLLRSAEDLMREGNHGRALKILEKALLLDPDNPRLQKDLSLTYNRLHRYEDAVLAAIKAARLSPKDPVPVQEFAWAKLHLGKAEEALEAAKRAIALDPKNAWSHVLAALAYEVLGDRDGMVAELEKAAALDSKYRGHLARALAGQRLFDPKNSDTLRDDLSASDALTSAAAKARAARGDGGEEEDERSKSFLGKIVGPGATGAVQVILALLATAGLLGGAWAAWGRHIKLRSGPNVLAIPVPVALAPSPGADIMVRSPAAVPAPDLVGKYERVRLIGRGSQGAVWEGRDRDLGRAVALKELAAPETEQARADLARDARRLASLQHPDLLSVYEVLDLPSGLTLVLEFAKGGTLQETLAQSKTLSLGEACRILAPVCAALEFAHAHGAVHRNLKPANILIAEDGRARLSELGLRGGDSPLYGAPEAVEGLVTPLSDVYSLGICLFEMLTGALPFGEEPAHRNAHRPFPKMSSARPELPAELDALVISATRPTLAARLRSPAEFMAALTAAAGTQTPA